MSCSWCGNQSPLFETPDYTDYCRFCCRGVIKPGPDFIFVDGMKVDERTPSIKQEPLECEKCHGLFRNRKGYDYIICPDCRKVDRRRIARLNNPWYNYGDTRAVKQCEFCGKQIVSGQKRYRKKHVREWCCEKCYKAKFGRKGK